MFSVSVPNIVQRYLMIRPGKVHILIWATPQKRQRLHGQQMWKIPLLWLNFSSHHFCELSFKLSTTMMKTVLCILIRLTTNKGQWSCEVNRCVKMHKQNRILQCYGQLCNYAKTLYKWPIQGTFWEGQNHKRSKKWCGVVMRMSLCHACLFINCSDIYVHQDWTWLWHMYWQMSFLYDHHIFVCFFLVFLNFDWYVVCSCYCTFCNLFCMYLSCAGWGCGWVIWYRFSVNQSRTKFARFLKLGD